MFSRHLTKGSAAGTGAQDLQVLTGCAVTRSVTANALPVGVVGYRLKQVVHHFQGVFFFLPLNTSSKPPILLKASGQQGWGKGAHFYTAQTTKEEAACPWSHSTRQEGARGRQLGD